MYGYDEILLALQDKLGEVVDPNATIPALDVDGKPVLDDDGNPTTTPDLTPIFTNIEIGKPKKPAFYEKVGGILILGTVTKTGSKGSNGQAQYQIIQGAIITLVPGDDKAATLKCLHYSDIVGDFCEDKTALNLKGTTIELLESNSQGWRPIDISKFTSMNVSQFKMTSTATTIFQITRMKQNQRVMPRF